MTSNRKLFRVLAPASVLLLDLMIIPAAGQSPELLERIGRRLESAKEQLIEVRRDIHRHPEPSGQEKRTAGIVAGRLRALGLEVRTSVGGHGVVAILRGGKPGRVAAFRADMDAVRSDSPDPVPFASQEPGVRHICGHDVHTTVGLGIAEGLAAVREDLPGTVVFIFQPAEENIQGARAMIDAGALRDPAPEAIFAVHCAPLEVGSVGSVEGLALPGLGLVVVSLRGGGDLEAAVQDYVKAMAGVSTRPDVPPADFISVMVQGSRQGSAGEWGIGALIRAGSPGARARAVEAIEQAVGGVRAVGVTAEVVDRGMFLPDMVNDTALVRDSLAAIRAAVGAEKLIEVNAVTPFFSEDFSLFLQRVPGAMYWLGVSNSSRGYNGLPHSPDFVADEEAIVVGARAMTAALLRFLAPR